MQFPSDEQNIKGFGLIAELGMEGRDMFVFGLKIFMSTRGREFIDVHDIINWEEFPKLICWFCKSGLLFKYIETFGSA